MKRVLLVALLVLGAAVAPTGVVAQSDDGSFFDGLVADDGEDGYMASAGKWLAGVTSGASRWYAKTFGEDAGNATRYANETAAEFNQHNETIEDCVNEQLTADTDHDVFSLYFHDRDGNNVTRYLVSNVSNGNWSNARILTPSEFNATNRTSDHWVAFDWYQSRNLATEVDAFASDCRDPDESLTKSDKAALLAKYGAPRSDMWNSTETN